MYFDSIALYDRNTLLHNLLLSALLLVVLQFCVLHVGVLMPRVVVVALQHGLHRVLRARVSPAEWWTVEPGPGGRDGGTRGYRAKSWDWPPPLLVSGAGAARCRPDMPAMCAILHRPCMSQTLTHYANVTMTNIN